MVNENQVLSILSKIIDPDFKKDIVTLGFVQNIKISKGKVFFDIELTTPACPVKEDFRKAAESLVLGLEGVTDVFVNMTSREENKGKRKGLLDGVKSVIAISSCKGGVGKSTMAATFASELASRGYRVGLLDLDIYGPSVPTLFNISSPKISEKDGKIQPLVHGNLKLMSFGFVFGDAPAVMRGPMVSSYVNQFLTNVEWGELDYLFLDMPPGTGDIQLTMAQSITLDGSIIVTNPSNLATVDVIKGIKMFDKVEVPVYGIVNNMAYFVCDSCDKKHYLFGSDSSSLKDSLGIDCFYEVPMNNDLSTNFEHYVSNDARRELVDTFIRAIGKNNAQKITIPEVSLFVSHLEVKWADGMTKKIPSKRLRESCKCALCVDEMTGEQILNKEDIPSTIQLLEAGVLGNYAISTKWSDGHKTGIYSYEMLREL